MAEWLFFFVRRKVSAGLKNVSLFLHPFLGRVPLAGNASYADNKN